jgi:hypothetical protein
MSERGPIQLLLPSLRGMGAAAACVGACLVVYGGESGLRGALEFVGVETHNVPRLGLSAVARRTDGDRRIVERPQNVDLTEAQRETVAVGDSITVTSEGGEARQFRITSLKLLDGGCPAADPQLADAKPSPLCWAADASGQLRFVIEVEGEPAGAHEPAQRKL